MFPIAKNDDVVSLLKRTHHEMLSLFYEIIDTVWRSSEKEVAELFEAREPGIAWGRKARTLKDLDALQISGVSMEKEELERRIRATHTERFPTSVLLHGYRFELNMKAGTG